ncbi:MULTISPECIES: aminoacyl-tRNA hydrolase [Sporosarcina]|uniref:aminoacyl-tRNA hydrolase n=1 Tax=Sporosarcina TaxID=1569 RepID=UPI00129B9FD1|nr:MULTISPECIES: aminoacyl-tRNA hydrolase [Sporosarcina]GKV66677.1 peptidyl-tRNA hydrolase [Sporosarcina sp. NCCP-2331]GLB57016.1 peptidyl-tRNA hydrolase [Sporosarcina sp. NCCP-2378]
MRLFIGLGNPGKAYEKTRHNIGFQVIDELAKRLEAPPFQQKFNGHYTTVHTAQGKVILVKPMTYMNLSGECVRPLADYFEVDDEELAVLYDDLDLPAGKIRLRQKGSAGGHNGMKSLIAHLGTSEFNRIRIGVDRPTGGMKVSDYVLAPFTKEELPLMEEAVQKSADACEAWSKETPFLEVMNKFNG